MKKAIVLSLLMVCISWMSLAQTMNANTKVLAYYLGGAAALDNYDATKMTHIIFCFWQGNQK